MEIEQFEFFPLWWTFASRLLPDPFRTAPDPFRIASGYPEPIIQPSERASKMLVGDREKYQTMILCSPGV